MNNTFKADVSPIAVAVAAAATIVGAVAVGYVIGKKQTDKSTFHDGMMVGHMIGFEHGHAVASEPLF